MEIDTLMQEGGAGQLEINLNHGDPIELADQVFMFKRTIREAALRHDCYATFMAKPMEEQPGSAMHLHQSVVDFKTGENLFNADKDQPSELFYNFIGGQQALMNSVVCMLAPYVNSYRRLVPDASAPINLEWGIDNRSTGIRVPVSAPQARRVENRVGGMDANPYLAIAACLACGYVGMTEKLSPRDSIETEAYELPRSLPTGVVEALDLFEADTKMTNLLGDAFSQVYLSIKREEYREFPVSYTHLTLPTTPYV